MTTFGNITIENCLTGSSKTVLPSGKTLVVNDGTISQVTGVYELMDGDGDRFDSANALATNLAAGATSADFSLDSLPPGYLSMDAPWTMNFSLTAPGNLEAASSGNGLALGPSGSTMKVTFLYYVKQVDAAAWYAYRVDIYNEKSGSWTTGPTLSIGNQPAARAT